MADTVAAGAGERMTGFGVKKLQAVLLTDYILMIEAE